MSRYRFVLLREAFFSLQQLAGNHRHQVLHLLEELENNPHRKPDSVQRFGDRDISITRAGKTLIFYWIDDAVCEVRVTEIRRLK